MKPIVVTACGFVDSHGCGSHHKVLSWEDLGGTPAAMRWRMFSEIPFDRFGRLDSLAKYAMVAVEMLGVPVDSPCESRLPTAILLGTQHGSISVDMKFHQSIHKPGGASPLLFPYTLPSAAVGEIAIRFHITGPNTCFVGGPQSGRTVLWEGVNIVQGEEVDACICVSCDAVSADAAFLTDDEPRNVEKMNGAAYAYLIETEDSAMENARTPIADVRISANGLAADRAAPSAPADDREMLGSLCAFLSDAKANEPVLRLDAPAAMVTKRAISFVRRL